MADNSAGVTTLNGPLASKTEGDPKLQGNLGTFGLFFSVMAFNAPLVVVIGVIPVMMATSIGIGTPILFVVGAMITAAFAARFLRMSDVLQRPGAFYAYITAGLGKKIGLGSGLAMLFAYFWVCAGYLPFGGMMLGSLVSNTFNGPELPWYVWASVFWAIVAVLGYLRVDFSAKVTAVILFGELIVVFIYDVAIFASGGADGLSAAPFNPSNWFDGSFGIGLLLAAGMFGGYEVTVLFRDEVRNPNKTIPRATYGLIACVAVLYVVTSWLFINALGVDDAASLVAADPIGAMDSSIITFGSHFLFDAATVLVNTSVLAVLVCAHNVGARYLFNLSADGVMPRSLSRVHARHGSPHVASMVVSAAALLVNVLVVALGLDAMAFYAAVLGVAALTGVTVFFLTAVAVLVYLRRTGNHTTHPWRSVILPSAAAVGFGTVVVLSILNFSHLTGGSQGFSNLLLVFVYGVFVFGFVLATILQRKRPEVYQRIGRQ